MLRFDVHQNDVRTDAADAVPGDEVVVPMTEQSQKFTGTRHDDGADTAPGNLNFYVGNVPQPAAVVDADDFFALQLCEFDSHAYPSIGFWYSLCGREWEYDRIANCSLSFSNVPHQSLLLEEKVSRRDG